MMCSRRRHSALQNLFITLFVIVFVQTAITQPLRPAYFEEVVEKRFSSGKPKPDWSFEKFCPVSTSIVAARVLQDYGAMFVANESVLPPSSCIQPGEGDVLRYQKKLKTKCIDVQGLRIEFQAAAADALQSVIGETGAKGFALTPLDGTIAGGRSYGDTLMLWNSRFFPGMGFWIKRGRLSGADRDAIGRLDLQKKVERILEWETQGIYFSTDRTRSIFTSTAPPGTSQHLALIALDVAEFWNPELRAILNRNGWFQTVVDDPAHFTYLGFPASELPSRGLRAIYKGSQQYWVPNMSPKAGVSKSTD